MKYLALILAGLMLSCNHADTPTVDISVTVEEQDLRITNLTDSPVHFAVFEQNSLAVIDWVATCYPSNEINPLGSVKLPWNSTTFSPSNVAVVFWWHKCAQNGGGIDVRSMKVAVP